MALKTADIIATVRAMRGARGGFEFMDRPRDLYYASLPQRLGPDALSEAQLAECAELGILADRDEEGVLLQIFTKPIGDRATLFLEIIQVGHRGWAPCGTAAAKFADGPLPTACSGVHVLPSGPYW